MTQQEFYELEDVIVQLAIQKAFPYGSERHKAAFEKIGEIAKKHGVFDQYKASGGGEY